MKACYAAGVPVVARGAGTGAIASANVGCIAHLGAGSAIPVRHWVALIDERLSSQGRF